MLRQYGQQRDDGRWHSPSAERNKGPILDVLRRVLPDGGMVLEIASGTGQHITHFARKLPRLNWQPTEPDDEMLHTIECNLVDVALPNIEPPLILNVEQHPWPITQADAVIAINLLHVSPWPNATQGLFTGASALQNFRGPLFLYGAFVRTGEPLTESNIQFNEDLLATNPDWGLRQLDDVTAIAAQHGFMVEEILDMPANNLGVVFALPGQDG